MFKTEGLSIEQCIYKATKFEFLENLSNKYHIIIQMGPGVVVIQIEDAFRVQARTFEAAIERLRKEIGND